MVKLVKFFPLPVNEDFHYNDDKDDSVTVVNRAANFESKFIANCNNMLLL